jgi:hypothetical protein
VRPEVVVDLAPVVVEDLGLEDRREDLAVEELVAKPGIEALDEGVLPGAARLDVDESTKLCGDTWAEADKSAMTAVG